MESASPCHKELQPKNFISLSNSGEFKCGDHKNENLQQDIQNIGRFNLQSPVSAVHAYWTWTMEHSDWTRSSFFASLYGFTLRGGLCTHLFSMELVHQVVVYRATQNRPATIDKTDVKSKFDLMQIRVKFPQKVHGHVPKILMKKCWRWCEKCVWDRRSLLQAVGHFFHSGLQDYTVKWICGIESQIVGKKNVGCLHGLLTQATYNLHRCFNLSPLKSASQSLWMNLKAAANDINWLILLTRAKLQITVCSLFTS